MSGHDMEFRQQLRWESRDRSEVPPPAPLSLNTSLASGLASKPSENLSETPDVNSKENLNAALRDSRRADRMFCGTGVTSVLAGVFALTNTTVGSGQVFGGLCIATGAFLIQRGFAANKRAIALKNRLDQSPLVKETEVKEG